ncbi:DoxX family protein [Neisseriaceae bacterium B1]
MNFLTRFQTQFLGLMRIVFGYLFMLHGTTKLFQMPYIERFANVEFMSIYGVAGVLELVGGLLLILGLFTRSTAFVLSGQMAVAYFMSHAKADNFLMPILNGGELAALYCFAFLYLAAAGSGAFALDNVLARKR